MSVKDSLWFAFKNRVGSGGGMIVHEFVNENENIILDKTWREIYDAVSSGNTVSVIVLDEETPEYGTDKTVEAVQLIGHWYGSEYGNPYYGIYTHDQSYTADEENGYPMRVD